jgi:flagellar motility protein MotE (MotC chaperone)
MSVRGHWVRTGVAVVVGVKLLGLLPFLSIAAGGRRTGVVEAARPAAEEADRGGKPGVPPAGDDGHPAPGAPLRIPGDGPSAGFATDSRGVRILLEALRRRAEELEARDAELARREQAIAEVSRDLDTKIRHLETLAAEARGPGARNGTGAGADPQAASATVASMEELGKIYGGMKAEEAAPLFNRLDAEIVYEVFKHMKQRQISAVLPLMDPEKAVALTELLGGRRQPTETSR